MRHIRTRALALLLVLLASLSQPPASANTLQLVVAEDRNTGYKRSAFKHWIDADKNGCNTRAEVLIEEAIIKPKIGTKCKLTGGKWLSAYDGKTITNASQLDVDHMVPLAEAWRSGAWKWTAAQRQTYANDLENTESLIAVTLSTNRSKGDKDPSRWMPQIDKCEYLKNWVTIKSRYSLSVDKNEERVLIGLLSDCKINDIQIGETVPLLSPIITVNDSTSSMYADVNIFIPKYEGKDSERINKLDNIEPFISFAYELVKGPGAGSAEQWCEGPYNDGFRIKTTPANLNCKINKGNEIRFYYFINNCGKCRGASDDQWAQRSAPVIINTGTPVGPIKLPTPTPSKAELIITPGAFCAPDGAISESSSGVTYTCKTSPTDSRNRWRQ